MFRSEGVTKKKMGNSENPFKSRKIHLKIEKTSNSPYTKSLSPKTEISNEHHQSSLGCRHLPGISHCCNLADYVGQDLHASTKGFRRGKTIYLKSISLSTCLSICLPICFFLFHSFRILVLSFFFTSGTKRVHLQTGVRKYINQMSPGESLCTEVDYGVFSYGLMWSEIMFRP